MTVQDEALAGKIRNALVQDKRVGGQPVAIRVTDGEVFLKGVVDTLEQCELAKMIAGGFPGVRQVNDDELIVKEALE